MSWTWWLSDEGTCTYSLIRSPPRYPTCETKLPPIAYEDPTMGTIKKRLDTALSPDNHHHFPDWPPQTQRKLCKRLPRRRIPRLCSAPRLVARDTRNLWSDITPWSKTVPPTRKTRATVLRKGRAYTTDLRYRDVYRSIVRISSALSTSISPSGCPKGSGYPFRARSRPDVPENVQDSALQKL